MAGAGIPNQGRGISKESVAGFAAAFAAVRRGFRVHGNFGKHNVADLHVSSEREHAPVHRRADPHGNGSGRPGDQETGTAERRSAKPDRAGREDRAAEFAVGAQRSASRESGSAAFKGRSGSSAGPVQSGSGKQHRGDSSAGFPVARQRQSDCGLVPLQPGARRPGALDRTNGKGLRKVGEGTMSIEIEVGLENATKAPRITEEELRIEETPKGLANPRVKRLLFLGGAVVVAAIAALFVYYHNRETTDDAQVDGHITPMASKVYGRVAQVLVEDNQAVKAGQVLVKIDPRDYQAALDQAKVEKSRANAELAKADLARYLPLMEKGEISKQQYDAAKANADATASALQADLQKQAQAQRSVEVAKAQLDAAKARVEQALAGVASAHADVKQVSMRAADAQAKLAKVEQARAALEAAELNLSYTEITAPVDGVATHKQVETGQIVQAGQRSEERRV